MKYLLLCAMLEECEHIQNLLNCKYDMNLKEKKIINCNYKNVEFGIGLTGIGMVNAAHSTTKIIEKFGNPKFILNFGCCGAHDVTSQVEDVIIGQSYISLANIIIDNTEKIHYYGSRQQDTVINRWYSNKYLMSIANKSISSTSEKWGNIGSSDIWHDSLRIIKWWNENFNTTCEDMEASAIAQIAFKYEIPFISVKDISNSIYLNTKQFNGFDHIVPYLAGFKSARFVQKMLDNILSYEESILVRE